MFVNSFKICNCFNPFSADSSPLFQTGLQICCVSFCACNEIVKIYIGNC